MSNPSELERTCVKNAEKCLCQQNMGTKPENVPTSQTDAYVPKVDEILQEIRERRG